MPTNRAVRRLIMRPRSAALAGPFTPASLPGLFAWYKVDAGVFSDAGSTPVTNGGSAQQWNDQSGNGNHLSQATSGKRPVWTSAGNGALRFVAASDQWMTSATARAIGNVSSFSVVVAANQNTATTPSFGRLFSYCAPGVNDAQGGSFDWAKDNANDELAFVGPGSGFGGIGGVTTGVTFFISAVSNGSTIPIYKNNTLANTPTFSAGLTTGGTLGVGTFLSSEVASGFTWDGFVYEIILTTAALTAQNRSDIQAYLAARWP